MPQLAVCVAYSKGSYEEPAKKISEEQTFIAKYHGKIKDISERAQKIDEELRELAFDLL